MFASVFVLLYVAHLLSDYPFQTDHQASRKAEKSAAGWRANLVHAGTHVAVSAAALAIGALVLDLKPSAPAVLVALAWVGISHSAIDRRRGVLAWMNRTGQAEFVKHGGAAHVDQTAHITALAIGALAMVGMS
ncbi:DUF3307 domain-containing protein [Streptomyces sp. NPDC102437]|uniref:DUF3307 domain-containing protein n=1 Tax=Streptomyces sp. NPDC102437 TaxID=3366175 RepID=UPI003821A1F9